MSYIGYTGSRKGMTSAQKKSFREIILLWTKLCPHHGNIFIHGGCIGADDEAHTIVSEISKNKNPAFIYIDIKPSNIKKYWGECLKGIGNQLDGKPPLERNKEIVDRSARMIACPSRFTEEQRSGTWSTIRYAKKRNIPVLIIWPDGMVTSYKEYNGSCPVDVFFRRYIIASNNEN